MYVNISFVNFFATKQLWKKFTTFHKQTSKNKHLEIETCYCSNYLFKFEFDARLRGRDHAGIRIAGNILGWELEVNFYDSRHWDYANNCWEK